jgi:hypothetical protein
VRIMELPNSFGSTVVRLGQTLPSAELIPPAILSVTLKSFPHRVDSASESTTYAAGLSHDVVLLCRPKGSLTKEVFDASHVCWILM